VSRKEKRISCITTISMAGDALTLLLVMHRRTIDVAVWEEGWRDGQDFMIRSNDTSYVTCPILTEYVTSVILPYFEVGRGVSIDEDTARHFKLSAEQRKSLAQHIYEHCLACCRDITKHLQEVDR
jgi:hypothetical protein